MTLLILKNGLHWSSVSNVPGNLKPSQVLPMALVYLGIAEAERHHYTAEWLNNVDYPTMKRWYRECEMRAELENLKG